MRQVTYQEYLNNPAIREQMEAEARRARSEAVHACIGDLLKNMFVRRAPALQLEAA